MNNYINEPKIVKKPWGKEEWIESNDHYCYKRIYINRGQRTSLQYHEKKLETNYVAKGTTHLVIGTDINSLEQCIMIPGDSVTIKPSVIHRFIAISDVILQEVSTSQVDDVIRISDDTNRPNGRIENEHN